MKWPTLVWEVKPPAGQCIFGKEVFWTTWIKRCLRFVVPNVWLSQGFGKNRPKSQSILNTIYTDSILLLICCTNYIFETCSHKVNTKYPYNVVLSIEMLSNGTQHNTAREMFSHVWVLSGVKGFPYRLSDLVLYLLIQSPIYNNHISNPRGK